ncbi:MAG: DMT family transporter [Planctomycetaceae bacterium]|nr:DMT family transporter [Planctomycetaceae bacterium]
MRTLLLMALAALAAGVIPVQASVNGRLGQLLQNPLLASLVSFTGGTLALGLLLLVSTPGLPSLPDGVRVPWYLMTGGLLGAVFVTTVLILAPRIGIANVLAASIAGQLIAGLIIDHYGLLNLPQSSISATKILGCTLLIGGMLLIQRG